MNTQRITVSLPFYIYESLIKRVPERKVSSFVSGILEEKLFFVKDGNSDPVRSFLSLRKKLPKVKDKEILQAIHKGRK